MKHHSIQGIATINDKGQVVIPAETRASLSLHSGDKLLVMAHPSGEGILLMKPDGLESFAREMLDQVTTAKDTIIRDAIVSE
jgi:AbrB family looped-hinge helix DNA binding protein